MAELCSSTRSARFRSRCRSSFFAHCRRASSSASEGSRRFASTCDSSPRRTEISRSSSPRGSFARILFYRLNVVPIRLPALRDRTSDIPLLVEHFLAKFNERLRKRVEGVEADARDLLVQYPWPGNIRELENVIERAVLFSDTQQLRASDLPPEVRGVPPTANVPLAEVELQAALASEGGLKEHVKVAMSRLEKELVSRALKQTSGNVTHAARLLKISRKGLQLKMKELGLREGSSEKGE